MDVEETLRVIRLIVGHLTDSEAVFNPDNLDREATALAEHVKALDEWLSKGGFLPYEWENPTMGRGGRRYNRWEMPVGGDDDGCQGHESLDGARMGESVRCDGSCR